MCAQDVYLYVFVARLGVNGKPGQLSPSCSFFRGSWIMQQSSFRARKAAQAISAPGSAI
jgi:hypothetical protein